MYFEGAEKKFELWLRRGASIDLRSWGEIWWAEVVAAARARILSRLSTAEVDAYLLSESSLFVYSDHVIMITCGQTHLPDAAKRLLERLDRDAIEMFIYQRKNECFPHHQPSSFFEDAAELQARLGGRAFRFGHEDAHHLFVFHLDRPVAHPERDLTVELLMYGLDADVRRAFAGRHTDAIAALGLSLDDYRVDEHHFEPSGYSLNAVSGEDYLTVHVTPDEHGSYCSLELSVDRPLDVAATMRPVLGAVRPRSYDLILWERGVDVDVDDCGYERRDEVVRELDCGYRVRFLNYTRPQAERRGAVELALPTIEKVRDE